MSDDEFSTERPPEDGTASPNSEQVSVLRAKLLQSELRIAAARAGIIDLDAVKLIDTAGLSVNESGEFTDAPDVIARLRQEKPWLFGRASTSSAATAPRATPPKPKSAMDMTVDEWRIARADLLRRR